MNAIKNSKRINGPSSLNRSFISLRHSHLTHTRKHSSIELQRRKLLITKLQGKQVQGILVFLRLGDILLLHFAVSGSHQGRQMEKAITRYLIRTHRVFTYNEQREFMEVLLNRRSKSRNHYRVNKRTWHSQTIRQDVERTHSQRKVSREESQKMKVYLNNVLCSLANVHFRVGYVQGLNFIVRNMHESQFSEVQAFNFMSYFLTEMRVEELYLREMHKVHGLCYVLEVYLFNYVPKVYFHLKKHQVPTEVYAASWFITLYAEALPPRLVNKIWTLFLIKGYKILIKFGVAVICALQRQIFNTNEDIFSYMRDIMKQITVHTEQAIWKLVFSLKITNNKVQLLASEMQNTGRDPEIQIWRLQYPKMKKCKTTFEQRSAQFRSAIKTSMCYESTAPSADNNYSGIFHLCSNIEHS